MNSGKIASQAGHAFLEVFLRSNNLRPSEAALYASDPPGVKVVLAANSLDRLLFAEYLANQLGIPNSLITDSGHIMPPFFDGSPIVTALGIGPATRAEVRSITDRFKLMS